MEKATDAWETVLKYVLGNVVGKAAMLVLNLIVLTLFLSLVDEK